MDSGHRIRIPRWFALMTGATFYTAVGALFFAPNPTLRLAVFLSLLVVWRFPRVSPVVLIVATVLTGGVEFWFGAAPLHAVATGIGWGSIAGTMLVALHAYQIIFHGADWAAIAVPLGERLGTNVALVAFFIYRALPDLESRVQRIVRALRTYGHRRHGHSVLLPVLVVGDGLIIYFLESIDILLAKQRIAERRRPILLSAAKKWRSVDVRTVVLGTWVVTLFILGSFIEGWALEVNIP